MGPCAAASWTLNNLIRVPFQTPTVPGVAPAADPTTISLAKMNPQSRDSYQPMERADHSKECTRTGPASLMMPRISGSSANDGMLEIKVRASGFEVLRSAVSGTWGVMAEMMLRIVCRGNPGSQDSS